jgi:hypothetical protein
LAGAAISPGSDSFDCAATAHRFAEMSRKVRAETDINVVYALGSEITAVFHELYPRRRDCLVSEVLPILTDLVDDPDPDKAFSTMSAFEEFGGDARPALPALRRAAERAKLAHDAWIARMSAESPDGVVVISGEPMEDTIRGIIGAIEDSHNSTAAWRDGLCYRIERRGRTEAQDFQFRVISSLPDSASCTDEQFGRWPSWTYSGPFGEEKFTESPQYLIVAWSGLSKLLEQKLRISQICPVSTRGAFSIDPVLAASKLQFAYQDEDARTFGFTFNFRDEARHRIVVVGFEFPDANRIGVKDLRAIECGSMPAP